MVLLALAWHGVQRVSEEHRLMAAEGRDYAGAGERGASAARDGVWVRCWKGHDAENGGVERGRVGAAVGGLAAREAGEVPGCIERDRNCASFFLGVRFSVVDYCV